MRPVGTEDRFARLTAAPSSDARRLAEHTRHGRLAPNHRSDIIRKVGRRRSSSDFPSGRPVNHCNPRALPSAASPTVPATPGVVIRTRKRLTRVRVVFKNTEVDPRWRRRLAVSVFDPAGQEVLEFLDDDADSDIEELSISIAPIQGGSYSW